MSGNLYCVHDLLNAIGRERLDNDSVILCVFFRFVREFLRNFEWRPKKAIVQGLLHHLIALSHQITRTKS